MQNSDRCCPLSARESNFKYQINAEMIELLSNKIQKIKQSIKETGDKGSNSISSIFKNKKIPQANKKPLPFGMKKMDDFIEKKSQNSKTRNKKNKNGLVGAASSNSNIGIGGNLVNTIINSIYQTNLLSPNKKNLEYDKLMKTFHKFKRPTNSFNGTNANNSKGKYVNNNHNNMNGKNKDLKNKKKRGRYSSINNNVNNYENNFNIEVNIKNNLKVQQKKQANNNNVVNNNKNANDNLNSLNINFNNYTNNYNYNYNINSIASNINNSNNNPLNNNANNAISINNNYSNYIINKGKSSSQKIIMGKIAGKTDNNLKGIPINGFDKLITKKYNSRNFNIPMSVTERAKQANMYATAVASNNTNSNRYRNSNSRHMTINRIYQKK